MKKQKLLLSVLLIAILSVTFTSCDSESSIDSGELVDQKSLETLSEIDYVSDGVNAIVEDVYFNEEFNSANKNSEASRFIPDCATITIVLEQNMKTVTVDFGEGCELRNGNVAVGKIIMEYEKDPAAGSKSIAVSFDGFYFNDKHAEGSLTVLRLRNNENGNPQSTVTADLKLTWPDATYASSVGTRTREWIEGVGNGIWADNVFLITGNWTFINRAGNEHSGTIIEPLRRELACKFIVSGIAEITKNGTTGLLDYGDEDCDDLAIVTIGDTEREIHLSKFHISPVKLP